MRAKTINEYLDWDRGPKSNEIEGLNPNDFNKILFLDARPLDPLDNIEYRAILVNQNDKNWKNENFWNLKIIYKTDNKWKLSPGQWDYSVLQNILQSMKRMGHDQVFISAKRNWVVDNMSEVIVDAIIKLEEENIDRLVSKQNKSNKKDLSKLNKHEIKKLVDIAIDKNDFETLKELSPYIKESLKFERGLQPKKAMDIGLHKCNSCGRVIKNMPENSRLCKECSNDIWQMGDYLKSSFRSWEESESRKDAEESAIQLTNILQEKFPTLNIVYIEKIAKEWTGVDDWPEEEIDESLKFERKELLK